MQDRSVTNSRPPQSHMSDFGSPPRPGRFDPLHPVSMPPGGGYQRYREMTIDEMLLENRVIFLVGEINYQSATGIIMRLLHLQNLNKQQDINLYVNSPGGGVDDTLAIYDTMRYLSCDVATTCIGRAMSGGAIVLAAGAKGKRFILPHAKVMIHQPYGGIYGQTTDVQIQAEEIIKAKRQLNEILARHTGTDVERIQQDSERDRFFSATEAVSYGLVDKVLEKPQAKTDEKADGKSGEKGGEKGDESKK